ncbi:hypothetical protein [Arcobacter sp.]|uniref:hypothetical protein n=1 Tax=Arcobacter sp. TaxID=1872629 RepID=UPI003C72EA8E
MKSIILDLEYLSGAIWEIGRNGATEYLEYEKNLSVSKQLIEKIAYLHNEIFMSSFDSSYPPDSGFKTINEVKYFLYYQLHVATLLSSEYKEGEVLLYSNNNSPCTIEEYIEYLSSLTDEDLKIWLRPDLQ